MRQGRTPGGERRSQNPRDGGDKSVIQEANQWRKPEPRKRIGGRATAPKVGVGGGGKKQSLGGDVEEEPPSGSRPGAEPGPRGRTEGGPRTENAGFGQGGAEPLLWRRCPTRGRCPTGGGARVANSKHLLGAGLRTRSLSEMEQRRGDREAAAWVAKSKRTGWGGVRRSRGWSLGQTTKPAKYFTSITQRIHCNSAGCCLTGRPISFSQFLHPSGVISKVPNANGILEKKADLKNESINSGLL